MPDKTLDDQLLDAVVERNPVAARRLLEQGVHPEAVAGRALLHAAIFTRSEEMVHLLLDAGANISGRDEAGRKPLYYAMVGVLRPISRDRDAAERILSLIARRAPDRDFNERHEQSATVAMRLILSDCPELALHVLPRSDLSVVDAKGRTALDLALFDARASASPRSEALSWRAVDILAPWVSDAAVEAARGHIDARFAPTLAARAEALALRSHIQGAADGGPGGSDNDLPGADRPALARRI